MHTTDEKTHFGEICRIVDSLRPGECIDFDTRYLMDVIGGYHHNDSYFNPADRVLENIVGSAYTHSYHLREWDRIVTFKRHADTSVRRYTSPDRR